jgi:hypothetical protein
MKLLDYAWWSAVVLLGLVYTADAQAQTPIPKQPPSGREQSTFTWCSDGVNTVPCQFGNFVLRNWGVMTPGPTSGNLSTGLTLGPNSAAFPSGVAFPLGGFLLYNRVGSTGPVYVCPLGGTCTQANGVEVGQGGSKTLGTGTSTVLPTILAPTGATVEIRF